MRFCQVLQYVFATLYLLALALFAVGTFGLFGQVRDPLSGAYLIVLGLPWNRLLSGLPEPALPWLGALAPAINLLILVIVCRLAGARRR